MAELPIRECRMGCGAARHRHRDARVLPIIGVGIGTISTDRHPGDIRDSGCPAAVRTANFRTKPARKTTGGAPANIKFTQLN
jgi:hypothetical protein